MENRVLTGVLLVLTLVFTPMLNAASGTHGRCTSAVSADAEQWIVQALMCAPSLQSLNYQVQASAHTERAAGHLAQPRLSIGVAPESYTNDQIDDGYQLELTQPLPWPGERSLDKSLATAERHKQEAEFRRAQIGLAAKVRAAFARWQHAVDLQEVSREQLILLEQIIEQLTARYRSGRNGRSALLQAKQQLLELKRETEVLAAQAEHQRLALTALSGTQWRAPISVGDVAQGKPTKEILHTALEQLTQHPALQLLSASQTKVSSLQAQEQKDRLPDVSLMARYNTLWENEDKRWMIGVAMNLPLDFSRRRARRDSLAAQADALQWQHHDRELQLETTLRQRFLSWREHAATRDLYEEQLLPLVSEQLEASLADYRAGTIDFQSLLITQREALAAQKRFVDASRDLALSRAEFIAAAGLVRLEELLQ